MKASRITIERPNEDLMIPGTKSTMAIIKMNKLQRFAKVVNIPYFLKGRIDEQWHINQSTSFKVNGITFRHPLEMYTDNRAEFNALIYAAFRG